MFGQRSIASKPPVWILCVDETADPGRDPRAAGWRRRKPAFAHGMTEQLEPVPRPVAAFRVWGVSHGRLTPLWWPGLSTWSMEGDASSICIWRRYWRRRDPGCKQSPCERSCGLHAYHALAAALHEQQQARSARRWHDAAEHSIVGLVVCWGRIFPGTRGLRAQHMRIKAVLDQGPPSRRIVNGLAPPLPLLSSDELVAYSSWHGDTYSDARI
jgi:hypothetical protein